MTFPFYQCKEHRYIISDRYSYNNNDDDGDDDAATTISSIFSSFINVIFSIYWVMRRGLASVFLFSFCLTDPGGAELPRIPPSIPNPE